MSVYPLFADVLNYPNPGLRRIGGSHCLAVRKLLVQRWRFIS